MALDLEEQEQLDELKMMWKKYGNMIANAVLAVVLVYVGVQAWKWYQGKQATEASAIYQTLITTDKTKLKEVQSLSAKLIESYGSTPYAGRAAVYAAQANHESNDAKSAKAQLEWALRNAKENAVQSVAGLQLANILLDEKDYDAALKILNSTKLTGFEGLKADLKGDVYVAQGKISEAKKAYAEALRSLDTEGAYRQLTQQKLEALGA